MNQDGAILLVEDSPDDVYLFERAYAKLGLRNPLKVVTSGEDAIHYLKQEDLYADPGQFPFPVLVFLDLKMRRLDGFEFLAWLRQQPAFSHLPVVVLTSSPYIQDVTRAYQAGANSFITKPNSPEGFDQALKQVTDFWLMIGSLPVAPENPQMTPAPPP
jgi:CheY-like chemotaxis protein